MKRLVWMILPLFFTIGCKPAGTFEGPGYTPEEGMRVDLETPAVVVITRALVAKGARREFNDYAEPVFATLNEDLEGFIGSAVRGEIPGREAWTLTAWESEADLMNFVTSDAHAAAMTAKADVTEEASFLRYTLDANQMPPTWEDALDRLEEEGRTY